MTANLKSLLQKASLPVEVVEKPSQVNPRLRDSADRGAFLMDIRRDKGETLVVRPGRADVQVLNVDPAHRQAVLFVHEHAGRVSFDRYDPRKRKRVTVTQHVPESRRHLLVGMDERHLFVAALPKPVSTVRAAHETLAPESIVRRHAERVVRQGEWFFTRVEDGDAIESIESVVRKQGTLRKTALGTHLGPRRGRPHIADERVLVVRRREADVEDIRRQLANLPKGARGLTVRDADGNRRQVRRLSDVPRYVFDGSAEYARGVVRHPDHRPRKLDGWHLVTSNAEPRQTAPVVEGMTWVD